MKNVVRLNNYYHLGQLIEAINSLFAITTIYVFINHLITNWGEESSHKGILVQYFLLLQSSSVLNISTSNSVSNEVEGGLFY